MNKDTTKAASKAAAKKPAARGKKPSKADIAQIWTDGLSSPDAARAAVASALAQHVERVDARGTVNDRAQVIAEFGQSPLAAEFAKGEWSKPIVSGDIVTSTCFFKPGAPWPGATVMITVTSGNKISRIETVASDEASARNVGGSATLMMPRDLEHIVHDVLRLTPSRVEPVRTMSGLRVHRVISDEHTVYIKHGRTTDTGGRFRLEAWAQQLCRAKGVLVPEVLAASDPGDEIDYMVTAPLAGRALEQLAAAGRPTVTGDALKPILRAAGEQLRAMHEIEVDGFGPIIGTPPRGAYERWARLLELAREAVPTIADHGVVNHIDAAAIDAQLAEAQSTLRDNMTGRLLHGDLEGDHLFSHRGKFTGFIDFEKMQAGDPVFDLARLAWWDAHMLADVLDGYGRDALAAEDIKIRMPAYLVAHAVAGWAWLAVEDIRSRPIRTGEAAMFIRAARTRDFEAIVAGDVPAARGASDQQPSQRQILVDAVKGKSDDEIARFAEGMGGYPRLCDLVFQGMRATMKPKDCTVGFVLGEDMGWVFRASDGKNTVTKRVPKRAAAIVHASPPDFLRMVADDLDWDAAVGDERVTVEGDEGQIRTLFAGRSLG
jgi:aminoglycoside phosphotransferase (APT) family kinase protein